MTEIAPALLMVAPNGARRGKVDHPALPITAGELAADAALCREAGAGAIHLHVRGDDGGHILDAERYREAMAEVNGATGGDLVIQITTESVGLYQPEQQMALVREVRPEFVSLAIRELV
ncbi:MAG: 3-keto-5-aminohexanoate cleavage protein, partial [Alphaproteobacteria bacterium]